MSAGNRCINPRRRRGALRRIFDALLLTISAADGRLYGDRQNRRRRGSFSQYRIVREYVKGRQDQCCDDDLSAL